MMIVTKDDGTIEAFGSEYGKSSWGDHQTEYCTRLVDVFNNSVLSVSTPAYPSAIEISPEINGSSRKLGELTERG